MIKTIKELRKEAGLFINQEYRDAYNDGLFDAWNMARLLIRDECDGGLPEDKVIEIFEGLSAYNVLHYYSAEAAIERLQEWADALIEQLQEWEEKNNEQNQ